MSDEIRTLNAQIADATAQDTFVVEQPGVKEAKVRKAARKRCESSDRQSLLARQVCTLGELSLRVKRELILPAVVCMRWRKSSSRALAVATGSDERCSR